MQVIIDRLEGEYAVVELPDRKTVNLPRVLIPNGREGDVVTICIDDEETQRRKAEVRRLMDQVFRNKE